MARFSDEFLEELKDRVRASDFIGKFVPLKKAGREYVGLSPFNKEKTPSFYVNDEKRQFFDFSSGKNGDLIEFLQETQRLTFVEAVETLAAAAGLSLPKQDARTVEQEKRRQSLADWLETAASWFEGELRRPGGRAAREYLEKRGLSASEWGRFRLGFAPGGKTALRDYLVAKGGRPADLVNTGMLIAPEDGSQPYDRFRDRIIFPILDARGRVVSFGGRALDPQARAKYLNGPETPVFHKGALLYGLSEARKILAADRADAAQLVVVEGYMDVIACHRAGIAAAAPMGTALTEDQLATLWRFHPEPTLCFDGDRAGRQAAARAIDRAIPLIRPGKSLRFAIVEGGKDPDDVLRQQGAAALRDQLASSTSLVDAVFVRERDAEPLDTPERRTALKDRLRKVAQAITHEDLAQAYRRELFARFDALWARPERGPGGRRAPAGASAHAKAAAGRLSTAISPLSAALALAAIRSPEWIDDAIEQVGAAGFGEPALQPIAELLVSLRSDGVDLERDALARRLQALDFDAAAMDRLERDARRAGAGAPFLDGQPDAATRWRECMELMARLAALDQAVDAAGANMTTTEGVTQLVALKTEQDQLRRRLRGEWWL